MKRCILLIMLSIAWLPLPATYDGRIGENRIPSISAELGISRQFVLYNAPLHDYISINPGFAATRLDRYGLTCGATFQWLDAEEAAGTLRIMPLFLVNRSVNQFLLGAAAEASVNIGKKKSGFIFTAGASFLYSINNDMDADITARAGVYFRPVENFIFMAAPGAGWRYVPKSSSSGKPFISSQNFFFDMIFSLETYLWK